MRSLGLTLLWLFGLAFAMPAQAASSVTSERAETTLLADVASVHAGAPFWTMLHYKLQPGWHTYWKNPGDSGTVLQLKWTLPNGFAPGDVQFQAPERLTVGPLVDYGYSDNAYFLVKITPPPIVREGTTVILSVKAQALICKDICVPETADLSLALPVTSQLTKDASSDASLIDTLVEKLPASAMGDTSYWVAGNHVQLETPIYGLVPASIKNILFFPATDGMIANAAPQHAEVKGDKASFTLPPGDGAPPKTADGLVSFFLHDGSRKDVSLHLVFSDTPVAGAAMTISANSAGPTKASSGVEALLAALAAAFAGGVILNLMPCVFPVLSLKALAIAKKADSEADAVRAQGLAYTAGVLVCFLGLALVLIFLKASGHAVGWGYQMQSPAFVASLATLLFAVALNLAGYFELPVIFGSVGMGSERQDNPLSSFFNGALAVMIATPCSAPYMAPALGYALTQSAGIILTVFAALGLGLAAPFLLVSLFPHIIRLLPKPGAWMLTFKQFLSFPMFLSAVWLLWVLARESGADAAALDLIGMVILAFGIWLYRSPSRIIRLIAVLVIVGGLASTMGLIYKVPVANQRIESNKEVFSVARLNRLRARNRAVFVDATAEWCITCKVNETVALAAPAVMQAFHDRGITYMVADWTHGDEEITNYLASFGRSGVPIYVYYPAHNAPPVVLPQVLTADDVLKVTKP